jgi:hypothetical protein
MMLQKDAKKILSSFFPELVDKTQYQVSQRVQQQYERLFPNDDEIAKMSEFYSSNPDAQDDLSSVYTERLLSDLIKNNEIFSLLESQVSIAMVMSESDSTCCFSYDGKQIVLFDRNTMLFYWMLNKAFLYVHESDTRRNQIILYAEILLYFLSEAFNLNLHPRPSTPPHPNKESLGVLTVITEIQESFVMAHEMAHIVLNTDEAIRNNSKFVDEHFLWDIDNDMRQHICEELEADNIALNSLISTFSERTGVFTSDNRCRDAFVVVTYAVFLLIRYNLWLNVAGGEVFQNEDTFRMWFVRNSFFRKYVSENYTWGTASYIVETLEMLEETYEEAALIVSKILKEHMGKK